MVRVVDDVGLARRDVALHGVEGRREALEFLATRDAHRGLVLPLLDAARRLYQLADRTRGAAPEHRADQRGQDERDAVDQQHPVAQVAVGSEHVLQRLEQDEIDRIAATLESPGVAQVLGLAEARDARQAPRVRRIGARCRERERRVESRAALGGRQRRGDEQRPTVPVRDDRHLRADEIAHSLRERVVGHEAHRDPGDDLGGAHRREEELVRVLTQHPEEGSVALAENILEQTRERSGAIGGRGRGGGEHPAVGIEEQHHVRADALGVVPGGRKDGGRVAARDRLAKAEVSRQHRHAVSQLRGAKADQLLGERAAGAQLLGGARLDRVAGADEHCGQRHSLGDHP